MMRSNERNSIDRWRRWIPLDLPLLRGELKRSEGDERGRIEVKMNSFAICRTMRAAWVSEGDDRSVCEAMRETYEREEEFSNFP